MLSSFGRDDSLLGFIRKSVRNWVCCCLLKKYLRKNAIPYYTYINTNLGRTTLYIGMTNNLSKRSKEHYKNKGDRESFAGWNYCYKLIYYELYQTAQQAIER